MSGVEISPVVKSIDVRQTAARAFRMFSDEISEWWPMATHTRAMDEKGQKSVRVTVEPRVGGRVYETLQTGEELDWGEVLAYEPDAFLQLAWRLGLPSAQSTTVSVRFEPLDATSCRVTLTHENWERLGEKAEELRNSYDNGWVTVFGQAFGGFAGRFAGNG